MDENKLFENRCFSPEWTTEQEVLPKMRQHKDLNTLRKELNEIKEQIQQIEQKRWHLANLILFHRNNFAAQ